MNVYTSQEKTFERVPPRRRRPRRSIWRKTVWPLVKYGSIAAVMVMLGCMVAGKIIRPFKLYNLEARETQRLADELQTLKKENISLERRIKYLQTQKGSAQAARRLGWVKPGEITLVLPESDTSRKRSK